MAVGEQMPMRARRSEMATVLIAGLLLLMSSPSLFATHWTAKAAVALLVIGPGLAALVVAVSHRDRVAWIALAFVLVAAVSTVASPAPMLALVGLYNQGTGWLFVVTVVGMWALGRRFHDGPTRQLGSVIVGAAVVNAAIAWMQSSQDIAGDLFTLVDGRPPALLGNPVHASALFVGAFAIVGERWRAERLRADPRRGASFGLLGLGFALASAVELAGGRTGLGVLAILMVTLAIRTRTRVIPMAAAVALGVVLAVWLVPGESGAASRVAASGESAFSGRIDRWKVAVTAVADQPVLGEGPGLYRRATSPHNTAAAARAFGADRLNGDAHNLFIEYLVTTGALGVLALTAWLVAASRGARGELAWFAAFGAVSLLLEPQFIGLTPVLALALGAAKRAPPVPMPRPVYAAAALVAVVGVVIGVLLIRGDVLLRRTAVGLNPADGRAALRALPIWPQAPTQEARAYKFVGISQRRASAKRDAIRAARVALRRDPSDPELALRLANLELAYGTAADARRVFAQALRWDPYSAQALVGLASFAAIDGDHVIRDRLCARAAEVVVRVHCPISLARESAP